MCRLLVAMHFAASLAVAGVAAAAFGTSATSVRAEARQGEYGAPCPGVYDLRFALDVEPQRATIEAGGEKRFRLSVTYLDQGTCPPDEVTIELCARIPEKSSDSLRAGPCRLVDVPRGERRARALLLEVRRRARGHHRIRFVAKHVMTNGNGTTTYLGGDSDRIVVEVRRYVLSGHH